MQKLEAVGQCSQLFELHGNPNFIVVNIAHWIEGRVTFEQLAYFYNMVNSDNLPWIECVRAAIGG